MVSDSVSQLYLRHNPYFKQQLVWFSFPDYKYKSYSCDTIISVFWQQFCMKQRIKAKLKLRSQHIVKVIDSEQNLWFTELNTSVAHARFKSGPG